MVRFQNFGKYEIVRKLGRSLTDVYLARDTEANRPVVLKLIEHARDEHTQVVIEAERRGAALQARLHDLDTRILQIYEYGEDNGCFFVAMEYCEGRTLAEIVQAERRLEPKRAARYAAEMCSQLGTLHSFVSDMNGRQTAVVHGDIKPSNVQIGPGDALRLLDFGIAKVISSTHNLTHHTLGSPSYCSPERISRSQVDQHSDLWAAGVTLYEMVAGAPPYQAQDTRKLENLIQSRRPPRALPPHCPAALKAIVAKALAGDLERRYPSAGAFGHDLEAFLANRLTVAERERQTPWFTNATLEKHRPEANRAARPVVRSGRSWTDFANLVALLAGILAGLLLFIPIGSYYRFSLAAGGLRAPKDYAHQDARVVAADWNVYKQLKTSNHFMDFRWSLDGLNAAMSDHLVGAASDILYAYLHTTGPPLSRADLAKASLCLRHALEIDPQNAKAKGELSLCTGYLDVSRAHPDFAQAIYKFEEAEWYLPRLADPHLALARIFVYQFHNAGRAVAEFHLAEQLGYKLGPRETEQEADAYLFRAESELSRAKQASAKARIERAKWLELARDDMERARNLYEPIVGFANVSTNLEQLDQDREEQSKLQMEEVRLVTPRPRPVRHAPRVRRWQ